MVDLWGWEPSEGEFGDVGVVRLMGCKGGTIYSFLVMEVEVKILDGD